MEFESITTTGLDEVGDDRLEGCEEGSEQSKNKPPGSKVVVSVCAILSAVSRIKRNGKLTQTLLQRQQAVERQASFH